MVIKKEDLQQYMRQMGGRGGRARAKKLTKAERQAIGRKAAAARWHKKGGSSHA